MGAEGWRRNLAALWVGQALTAVGFSFIFPFVPLFIKTMGVEGDVEAAQWAGVIVGIPALSMAVVQPFWGRLADRSGRKPMVMRSIVGSGVLVMLMSLATSPEQLLVLRFIQGAVTGVSAAATALVAATVPRQRMGFALGLMQVGMFVGTSVGPLVGGVVADALGFRIAYAAAGCLMLLGAVVVGVVVKEDFTPAAVGKGSKGLWSESRSMLAVGLFPLLVGVIFLIQFGNTTMSPVLSLFIAHLSAGGNAATAAGVVLGVTGVVSALSALLLGRISDRVGHGRILRVCLLGAALSYFPQALVEQVWQLLVLRILLGVFLGGLMPSANAMVAVIVPPGQRGVAFGLASSAAALSHAAGPLFGAGVASVWGMREVFIATGTIFGLGYLWAALGLRRNPPPRPRAGPPPTA